MLIKTIKKVTYLSSRLFPKKAELIVVDLDLEFQVGIDQVMIKLDLNWFELYGGFFFDYWCTYKMI